MIYFLFNPKSKFSYLALPVFTNHQTRLRGVDSSEHRHMVYHLIFITEGQGIFQGKVSHRIQKRDLVFVSPGERHIFSSTSPSMRYFSFTFYLLRDRVFVQKMKGDLAGILRGEKPVASLAETRDLHRIFGLSGPVRRLSEPDWTHTERLIERYFEAVSPFVKDIDIPDYLGDHYSTGDYEIYLRQSTQFLAEMTSLLIPPSPKPRLSKEDPVIQKIKSVVEGSVHEKYSLRKISDGFGYTSQHLAAYFRKKTGGTIGDFAMHLKIKRACDYLRETDRSLTEIARLLDFSSSQHFSTVFKKLKGSSPRDYRRTMK